jgi:hypothetical protein
MLKQRHRIGQLRQQSRGHKGTHLDLALPRRIGGIDPGLFLLGWHDARNALQAIAQPDFAYCCLGRPVWRGVRQPLGQRVGDHESSPVFDVAKPCKEGNATAFSSMRLF